MEKFEQSYMEEQILRFLDNELDKAVAEKVKEQIALYPAYKELYEEYKAVYLTADDEIETVDFNHLLKEEETQMPIVKTRRLIPVWASAASIALVLVLSIYFLSNKQSQYIEIDNILLSKSDKAYLMQNPVNQVIIDSIEKKNNQKRINQSPKPKIETKENQNPQTRLAYGMEDSKIKMPVEKIYQDKGLNTIQTIEQSAINIASIDNKKYVDRSVLSTEYQMEEDNAKGLFPEMIKAGQWLFSEKKPTTVELAIGNKENRTIKLKF